MEELSNRLTLIMGLFFLIQIIIMILKSNCYHKGSMRVLGIKEFKSETARKEAMTLNYIGLTITCVVGIYAFIIISKELPLFFYLKEIFGGI